MTPVAAALREGDGGGRGGSRHHRLAAGLLAAVVLAWVGVVALAVRDAALPPEARGSVVAVFPPTLSGAEVLATVARADGRPVRTTWLPNAWIVHGPAPGFAGRLEAAGAWGAFASVPFEPGGGALGGCPFVPRLLDSAELAVPPTATLRR